MTAQNPTQKKADAQTGAAFGRATTGVTIASPGYLCRASSSAQRALRDIWRVRQCSRIVWLFDDKEYPFLSSLYLPPRLDSLIISDLLSNRSPILETYGTTPHLIFFPERIICLQTHGMTSVRIITPLNDGIKHNNIDRHLSSEIARPSGKLATLLSRNTDHRALWLTIHWFVRHPCDIVRIGAWGDPGEFWRILEM